MRTRSLITCVAALSALLPLTSLHIARAAEDLVPEVTGFEAQDRRVDQAALDSQAQAIRKLQEQLRKARKTPDEAQLLYKLAGAQIEAASMQFRIAHGSALRKESHAELGPYKGTLKKGIATLNELIARAPKFSHLAHAYFMRGKAHEETGNLTEASADYLHLVHHYPGSESNVAAHMALGRLAMDRGDFSHAAEYLAQVERHRDSPYYPHALYKLAWCHYNLKDVPRALAYAEKTIAQYSNQSLSRSDEALRENAFLDSALFFLEGREQKRSHFEVTDALAYFQRLDSGTLLGKILVRYAKLLRSHGHEEDLAAWRSLVLREEGKRPEAFDVIVIAFEDQFNKRKYTALVASARDLVKQYNPKQQPESLERAQKLLLDAAHQLQTLISRNKEADGVSTLTTALAGIYDAFTQIVDESDPRIPKVHFNLAESLFEIRQFDQATEHYRWIVSHGSWDSKRNAKGEASVPGASLRAIASRYEVLRARGLIPGKLDAQPIAQGSKKPLDPQAAEWIDWIETHARKMGVETVANFSFEANRYLYAFGDRAAAVERMTEFSLKFPTSKFAPPSATLVVDTCVASADWEKLRQLSSQYLNIPEWRKTDFAKRLYELASDADYKSVETTYRSKDYAGTVKQIDRFLQEYPDSKRRLDALALAGHAALADHDYARAQKSFDELLHSAPGTPAAASALLARASIDEERYDHAAASRAYLAYLALPADRTKLNEGYRNTLRKKALAFAWISGETALLRRVLATPGLCAAPEAPALQDDCDRATALLALHTALNERKPGPEGTEKAFARARRGPVANRALWAALALEGARHLAFRDRHVAIRLLASHWSDLDSLARLPLIGAIHESIPKAIELNRRQIRSVAPLVAKEAYVVRRMEAIREIENAALVAAKLPWTRIRATVTNELAELYSDTAKSLTSLRGSDPAIAQPFLKKADDLRAKAFAIASAGAIEDEAFDAIAQPYLHADPRRLAALPKNPVQKPQAFDLRLLEAIDAEGGWNSPDDTCNEAKDAANCLRSRWYQSVRHHQWPEAAFLLQRAKDKHVLSPGSLALARAFTLAGLGARAEGLAELASARKELPGGTRREINRVLLEHYQNSLAMERARSLMNDMQSDGDSVAQNQGRNHG